MDETLSILTQSKNEYSALLVNKLTHHVMEGMYSIFNEAVSLCEQNDEYEQYLSMFQEFLKRVPRWNSDIVNKECSRIKDKSNCPYLEDLLTCVHVAQTKILTSVRVGTQQKKIHTKIPSLAEFVHKVYIEAARNAYKNAFLFEREVNLLQKQKYRREIERFVQYSILTVIRETLPVEDIIRAYLDESVEYDNEEVIEEVVEEPVMKTQEQLDAMVEERVRGEKKRLEEEKRRLDEEERRQAERMTKTMDDIISEKAKSLKEITGEGGGSAGGPASGEPAENVKLEVLSLDEPGEKKGAPAATPKDGGLKFSDIDRVKEYDTADRSFEVAAGAPQKVEAPKTIERLERVSEEAYRRRAEEEAEDDEDALNIGGAVELGALDLGVETL
jgi:hypothetical protein